MSDFQRQKKAMEVERSALLSQVHSLSDEVGVYLFFTLSLCVVSDYLLGHTRAEIRHRTTMPVADGLGIHDFHQRRISRSTRSLASSKRSCKSGQETWIVMAGP